MIDSSGRLVVAGTAQNCATATSAKDIALFRFKTDGTLDTGFGPSGTGRSCVIVGGTYYEEAYALAIDPDGKLVTAGLLNDFSGQTPQLLVARLSFDGIVDTTFGVGSGVVASNDATHPHIAFGISFDASKRILAYGTSDDFTAVDGAAVSFLARITTDGQMDTTFATGGTRTFTTAFGRIYAGATSGDALFLSGQTLDATEFDLFKMHLDGSDDGGFPDQDTQVSTTIPVAASRSLVVQGDGKILSAGLAYSSFTDGPPVVARYAANGPLDSAGWGATAPIPGVVVLDILYWNYNFQLKSLLLDDAQRVLVGGYVSTGDPTSKKDLAVVRLTTAGVIDTTYGTKGVARSNLPGDEALATLVMEPTSKKVIAVGTGPNNKLALARFFP